MKRPFPLTPAQRRALDVKRNIAVTASAGSGKTATLVERFIDLLRHNTAIGPQQILAITFTQKAAAEMRQRLEQRLHEAIPDAAATEAPRLAAVLEALPAARISTIHAFCANLLRAYPIEAGVDPSFAVIEEAETQRLERRAIDQSLVALAARPDGDPAKEGLGRLLGEWGRRYTESALQVCLKAPGSIGAVLDRAVEIGASGLLDHWQTQLRRRRAPAVAALMGDQAFLEALQILRTAQPHANPDKDTAAKRILPIRDDLTALLQAPEDPGPHLSALADALLTKEGQPLSTTRIGARGNWDADALAAVREALATAGACLAPHVDNLAHALAPRDQRAADLHLALAPVLAAVRRRYARLKGDGARLDFNELQERCLDLIRADDGALGRRMAAQIRYVMVDEFQDTDQLQWDLIRPLVCGPDGLAADKLFIVGDPKQSIYGFRNADVAVFNAVKEQIRQANARHGNDSLPYVDDDGNPLPSTRDERLGDLQLAENFRTLAAPIALVNHLFPRFMQASPSEDFQVAYEPLIGMRPAPEGSTELLLVPPPPDEEEDADPVLAEADLLAARLALLLDGDDLQIATDEGTRPPRPQDVAVLLRRRRFLPQYEAALRRQGIPYQVVGGLGFYEQQEVFDLYNLLQTLRDPGDPIALLGSLRSPYIGLSDNALLAIARTPGDRLYDRFLAFKPDDDLLAPDDPEALHNGRFLLARWQSQRDRVPLAELLHTLLEDSGAWGFLRYGERGAQAVANVVKLLSMARDFEAGGYRSLADFVDYLDEAIDASEREGEAVLGSGDAVRLMTVHASKGLEFPVVACPDLDAGFGRSNSDEVLLDPQLGLGLTVLDPDNDYCRTPSLVRQLIHDLTQRKTAAEAKRLFYVATTRARDHLILSGRLQDKHFNVPDAAACSDFLGWISLGLNLQESDLDVGEKCFTLDGVERRVRLYTDPQALMPAGRSRPAPLTPPTDWEPLAPLHQTPPADPAALDSLKPLVAAPPRPRFAATQVALFEADPDAFRRQTLGLDDGVLLRYSADPADARRADALAWGRLVHAALEARALGPTAAPEPLVDRLLRQTPLTGDQAESQKRLLAVLATLPPPAADSRIEVPFILSLDDGDLTGTIDRIDRSDDGLWHILDFKTGLSAATAPQRHQRQMQIYALCLHRLHPTQPQYQATLHMTAQATTHTFTFSPQSLAQAAAELNSMLKKMAPLTTLP